MFGSLISSLNFALNIHNEIMEGQYIYKYPHPAVTTDCVIFGYEPKEGLSVLLIKRGIEPFKDCWAFPGGFIRMDENAETGARRELQEETGLETAYMEQFGCFSDVNRDPRESDYHSILCTGQDERGQGRG